MVGGASSATDDGAEPIKFYQNAAGGVPGPFDAYLTLRGLKTLAVRMERHCENARRPSQPGSSSTRGSRRCYYPGLTSHPGHRLATHQMRDFGGMISILSESEEDGRGF